jgi:hypothetical protein
MQTHTSIPDPAEASSSTPASKTSLANMFSKNDLCCPLSLQPFYKPVLFYTRKNSQRAPEENSCTFERHELEAWIQKCRQENKEPHCPSCRGVDGEIVPLPAVLNNLMIEAIESDKSLSEERYFNCAYMQKGLLGSDFELFKIGDFFIAHPKQYKAFCENQQENHNGLVSLVSSASGLVLLEKKPGLITNFSSEALNAINEEGPNKGESAVFWLAAGPAGREFLKDPILRAKINSEALNAIIEEGPDKGTSAVLWLAATPTGRELLKDPTLRAKINPEALNTIIEEGPNKGQSAVFWLATTPEGCELLKDPTLRAKINSEALNAIIEEGPDKGESAVFWLASDPIGREFLKDPILRAKINPVNLKVLEEREKQSLRSNPDSSVSSSSSSVGIFSAGAGASSAGGDQEEKKMDLGKKGGKGG